MDVLYNSTICRLCGEENPSGVFLYSQDETDPDLCGLINKYLPCKVQDDGKLPRTICPGCNIQLHATIQFFDLLVEGQKKIRDLWKNQVELQKRIEKDRQRLEQNGIIFLTAPSDNVSDKQDSESLTNSNTFDTGIVLKILEDGMLFASEHELSLKMDGLERPRRKRGRPPKKPAEVNETPVPITNAEPEPKKPETQREEEEEEEYDADGRKRRKRKVPQRFKEAVQGKELDRLLLEEGIINEEEQDEISGDDDEDDEDIDIEESLVKAEVEQQRDEVIGHLESSEGADLGELVIVNHTRKKPRPPRIGRRKKMNYQCEICGKVFLHRGRFRMHKTFHKGVTFECGTCNRRFPSKDSLQIHQKEEGHEGEGIIEGSEDTEVRSLERRIQCDQCDKSFQTKQSYEVHVKAIHEGFKPFGCEICGKKFAYPNSLKCHVWATHEDAKDDKDKKYGCDECDKRFNHPSSVVYHKEAQHNNGRRFVCNKCGKGFKHRQLLQRHQLVHSETRPYECKLCGATFKTKANLLNHQPTHTGEKKYSCEMCGQQFAHKTSLTLHYRWHTGVKPYTCDVCKKNFSQNGNLQEHMRIHTGEKPFGCNYCGRRFTTSSQSKLHLKRHTGERPWKCEFCGKTFLHKDTWKCHTRRHRGERPFECMFCNRGFTEQWALKKHLRLHTGEKPYTCNYCGKTFADCSNLTKHKKIHREEGAANGAMWDIIKTHLSNESTQPDADGPTESCDEVQQIIYVAYQDPDDPDGKTLHIMDDIPTSTKLAKQSLHVTSEISELKDEELELEQVAQLAAASHPLEVMDEEGNPIQFAMADGQQLQLTTTDGQSLQVTTLDGHTYPVQLATLDGQVITDVTEQLAGVPAASTSGPDTDTSDIQDENIAENLRKASEEIGVHVDDLTVNDQDEHTVEFVTEDGQKVRFVTSYNLDSLTGHDYFAQSSQLAQ